MLDTLLTELTNFARGVIMLDPEQAAIRAGLTLLVFIGAALMIWGLRIILKALAERFAPAEPGAAPRKRAHVGRWSLRIARLAIWLVAFYAVLRVWGFEFEDIARGPLGGAAAIAGRIALILVLSLAAIELAHLAINRSFARIAARARSARRSAQLRTLGPLIAGVATTALVLVAVMMTLSEIGVEIGPLIAGAGIVGLAVGFGAQTLVKDFLTGIFLLLEDIVSIGDVVMIQDFGGVVEEMSLRTIKLRDFDGTLHVFPYSEAMVIHNRSKGFGYAVMDLSVDYTSDIPKALEVMKRIGEEVRQDEEFSSSILDDIEIVGVDQLADSAIMLKARIKTAPAKQWAVRREYLKRIKTAFDEAGIEIPFPHMKLVPPDQAMLSDRTG
ncbi:MAG: mechanosensitive ion channel family protein [Hyphomonadaceae bacterium]